MLSYGGNTKENNKLITNHQLQTRDYTNSLSFESVEKIYHGLVSAEHYIFGNLPIKVVFGTVQLKKT